MSKKLKNNMEFTYNAYGDVIMASFIDENGRKVTFFTDLEDNGLDLFNVNRSELIHEIVEAHDKVMINVNSFDQETFNESVLHIKLPKDSSKMKGTDYKELREEIDSVDHVNIYINDQLLDGDETKKHYIGWIWVELPKEDDGIKYVPFIIHTGGAGVSVHPKFRKYFLRAFDKKTRHLIIGYLYTNGNYLLYEMERMGRHNIDMSNEDNLDVSMLLYKAMLYKDSDAPKRIDAGPAKNLGPRFDYVYKDYMRWLDQNK